MILHDMAKLRRRDAARYLGVSTGFLEKAAIRGDGPPMLKLSARLVVYDRADLDAWVASHRTCSSSQPGGQPA